MVTVETREAFSQGWIRQTECWGFTRTMAEIHAALLLSPEPMSVDDFMQALGISRGNVSMSTRQLEEKGFVEQVHKRGERRAYYRATVESLYATVAADRRHRDFEVGQMLAESVSELRGANGFELSRALDAAAKAFAGKGAMKQV